MKENREEEEEDIGEGSNRRDGLLWISSRCFSSLISEDEITVINLQRSTKGRAA